MKTIGLIGGMSWESSQEYYRIINQEVNKKIGGATSAKIIMYSLNFAEVEKHLHAGEWKKLEDVLVDVAIKLENASADFILICTNTMHKHVPAIEKKIKIPIVHIGTATGQEIHNRGLKKVGLLGTKFTMEEDFYKKVIFDSFGIETIIPNESERETIHRIIFKELVLGNFNNKSKKEYIEIIKQLEDQGAQGVILGCTEIPLLIKQGDVDIPMFDTTYIHSVYAAKLAIEK